MYLKINAIINNNSDVDFDNMIFSAFCSKCCFFITITYIQVLIKKCLKLEYNIYFFVNFDALHVQIFMQQNIVSASSSSVLLIGRSAVS